MRRKESDASIHHVPVQPWHLSWIYLVIHEGLLVEQIVSHKWMTRMTRPFHPGGYIPTLETKVVLIDGCHERFSWSWTNLWHTSQDLEKHKIWKPWKLSSAPIHGLEDMFTVNNHVFNKQSIEQVGIYHTWLRSTNGEMDSYKSLLAAVIFCWADHPFTSLTRLPWTVDCW